MRTEAPASAAGLDVWLQWLEQQHHSAIELGLDRVGKVARTMDLHQSTAITLVVGGTNGKGSSVVLLDAILRAAGYRVGRYLSPHLRRYNERVCIDGKEASDAVLCEAFAAVAQARGEVPLSYFEFGTLAALLHFRACRVDIQILEVGLGGRLDAVNILDHGAALITSVGLDHQEYLGNTLAAIAVEKAGIVRADRPAVVTDPQSPAALLTAIQTAGARLMLSGKDFGFTTVADAWSWWGPGGALRKLPMPAMPGSVAMANAAAVIALLRAIADRCPVPAAAFRQGLVQWQVPGRFEFRQNLILDVAHNPQAAQALSQMLLAAGYPAGVQLVLGMLADKDAASFVAALGPGIEHVHTVGLPGPRGLSADGLAERLQPLGVRLSCHGSVAEAIAMARTMVAETGVVLATGSFLTVTAVMEFLDG